jgi:hypothetical protein
MAQWHRIRPRFRRPLLRIPPVVVYLKLIRIVCDLSKMNKGRSQITVSIFIPKEAGVDVMITIYCDFCQFSAKKIGVFLKSQCHDEIFS